MRVLLAIMFLVVSTCLLSACSTVNAVKPKIIPRASFDLDCPESEIKVIYIEGKITNGGGFYGATGCGKRISYNAQCSSIGTNCNITAQVADGVVK
jgi:hypothetical protein